MYCQRSCFMSLIYSLLNKSKHSIVLFSLISVLTISYTQEPRQGSGARGPCGNKPFTVGWILSVQGWVWKQEEGTCPISSDPPPKPRVLVAGQEVPRREKNRQKGWYVQHLMESVDSDWLELSGKEAFEVSVKCLHGSRTVRDSAVLLWHTQFLKSFSSRVNTQPVWCPRSPLAGFTLLSLTSEESTD